MDNCVIFVSKYEDYYKSAEKIKQRLNLLVNIEYIEDFMIDKENIKKLKNSIIYFLCNTVLNKKIIEMLKDYNCYIFNKKFYEKNYTKLEIQKLLSNNNVDTPKIKENIKLEEIEIPVFCKENKHAGMIFEAFTSNTVKRFFEKFNKNDFYIEEKINGENEVKYYYVSGNIYSKENIQINETIKLYCNKIKDILGLEIFSIDIIKSEKRYIVFDVNPSAGFYLLDEARNDLIKRIEKLKG